MLPQCAPSPELLERIISTAAFLHGAGPMSPQALRFIARYLFATPMQWSAETGSGVSTLLFSHLSRNHLVFATDDSSGSIANVRSSPLFNSERVTFVEGPTQLTLPAYGFRHPLQAVLLDGPHAFPFPHLEYLHLYPHLETGALLAVDDIQIPSVHQLFQFLRKDAMFEPLDVIGATGFFRRTKAPLFPRDSDGWWEQAFNQHPVLRYCWKERLRQTVPQRLRRAVKRTRSTIAGVMSDGGRVSIESPGEGSCVGAKAIVRGRAELPGTARLWVFVKRQDLDKFWPQGRESVQVQNGDWHVEAAFGERCDIGCTFEVTAVILSSEAHAPMSVWSEHARATGHACPVPLPAPKAGTTPATLRVPKTEH